LQVILLAFGGVRAWGKFGSAKNASILRANATSAQSLVLANDRWITQYTLWSACSESVIAVSEIKTLASRQWRRKPHAPAASLSSTTRASEIQANVPMSQTARN